MRSIRKPNGPARHTQRGEVPLHERVTASEIMDMSMDEYARLREQLLKGASEETKRWYKRKKLFTYTDALVCREADVAIERPMEFRPWEDVEEWLWNEIALELKVRRDKAVEDIFFNCSWKPKEIKNYKKGERRRHELDDKYLPHSPETWMITVRNNVGARVGVIK